MQARLTRGVFTVEARYAEPRYEVVQPGMQFLQDLHFKVQPVYQLQPGDISGLTGQTAAENGIKISLFYGVGAVEIKVDRMLFRFDGDPSTIGENTFVTITGPIWDLLAERFGVALGAMSFRAGCWFKFEEATKEEISNFLFNTASAPIEFDSSLGEHHFLPSGVLRKEGLWHLQYRFEEGHWLGSHLFADINAYFFPEAAKEGYRVTVDAWRHLLLKLAQGYGLVLPDVE
jgi:hypothetical protein